MLLVLLNSLPAIVFLCGKIGNPTSEKLSFWVFLIVFSHSLSLYTARVHVLCILFHFGSNKTLGYLVGSLKRSADGGTQHMIEGTIPRIFLFNIYKSFYFWMLPL